MEPNSINGDSLTFDRCPFFTISKTKRITQNRDGQYTEEIETPVSKFNFDNLITEIIENGEYADQELLKMGVSYRFIDSIGSGETKYEEEGLRLQCEIVKHIVRRYNSLREDLGMDYSEKEKETGIVELMQ